MWYWRDSSIFKLGDLNKLVNRTGEIFFRFAKITPKIPLLSKEGTGLRSKPGVVLSNKILSLYSAFANLVTQPPRLRFAKHPLLSKEGNFPHQFSFCLLLVLATLPLSAQVGQNYFPADPANIYDWRSAMVNPSISDFQNGAVDIGFKILYLGFADNNASAFKASYVLLNVPRRLPYMLTGGFQLQLFSTPLYQETELKFIFSRRIKRIYSVGLSLGLLGVSYNRDNFDLVDPGDPVFAKGTSRWPLDIGLGVTMMPTERWLIGLGIRHLNSPPVSLLNNDVKLSPTINIGVSFSMGSYSFHGGTSQWDEERVPSGFVQLYDPGMGMAQAGLEKRMAWMRGYLNVRGPLSVGYGFSYPLKELAGSTSGTHEAFLIYEFDRARPAPSYNLPPDDNWQYTPGMSRIGVVPQYYTAANVEALDIFEKQLIREVEEDLDSLEISSLTAADVGLLDSTSTQEPVFPFELEPAFNYDSSAANYFNYTPEYLRSLQDLQADLGGKAPEVVLIAPRTQDKRASGLGNYITKEVEDSSKSVSINRPHYKSKEDSLRLNRAITLQELLRDDNLMVLKPAGVVFTVFPIMQEESGLPWQLIVENEAGERVYQHSGNGSAQTEVAWDWRDSEGRIIEPGFYRYYVSWEDRWGQERHSAARILYARKLKRNIRIKVTRSYQKPDGAVNKVGIIFK